MKGRRVRRSCAGGTALLYRKYNTSLALCRDDIDMSQGLSCDDEVDHNFTLYFERIVKWNDVITIRTRVVGC